MKKFDVKFKFDLHVLQCGFCVYKYYSVKKTKYYSMHNFMFFTNCKNHMNVDTSIFKLTIFKRSRKNIV